MKDSAPMSGNSPFVFVIGFLGLMVGCGSVTETVNTEPEADVQQSLEVSQSGDLDAVVDTERTVLECKEPCNDSNSCTADQCDADTGQCVFIPTAAGCDDGDSCSVGDHCVSGTCVSGDVARNCNDDNPCTVESCLPSVGCKFEPTLCNDANACTVDSCDPAVGCLFEAQSDGAHCDDGNPGTGPDSCTDGICTGVGKDCSQYVVQPFPAMRVNSLKFAGAAAPGLDLNDDGVGDNALVSALSFILLLLRFNPGVVVLVNFNE
ncbi:MAG TPA: hypothetical protein EYN66_10085, partial [Myxococcales bacterium]|nr:hypothetical protein [Myxococcales bacterium]